MWTEKDAASWMVSAERADRRTRNPGEARPASWPERFVPDPQQRSAMKLWVWCEAHGEKFHDVCQRRGLSYTTALRRKNTALARITMLLNLQDSLKSDGELVAAAG